jgi:hypothetical protein
MSDISRLLIQSAHRAPSSHNTQPWKFKVQDETEDQIIFSVYADGTRRLVFTDLHGRELIISCACAIMNLKVQAETKGYECDVELVPVKNILDVENIFEVAKVKLVKKNGITESSKVAMLAQEISQRVTFRGQFTSKSVPDDVLKEIKEAIEEEGAWFEMISTNREISNHVADMIYDANDVQWNDPKWRAELAHWIRPSSEGQGLAIGPDFASSITSWFIRHFKFPGNGAGSNDRRLALSAPVLAVLGCYQADIPNWIKAGQALERALLIAAKHDVFASFFNQPLQVEEFAGLRLSEAIGRTIGCPCMILRMGYADNAQSVRAKPSSRRPVENIVLH